MSEQLIIDAIVRLAQEEKPITTATVKARLSERVNMAQLIQLVGQYKHAPEQLSQQVSASITQEPTTAPSLLERIAALEEKVARLERQLAALG